MHSTDMHYSVILSTFDSFFYGNFDKQLSQALLLAILGIFLVYNFTNLVILALLYLYATSAPQQCGCCSGVGKLNGASNAAKRRLQRCPPTRTYYGKLCENLNPRKRSLSDFPRRRGRLIDRRHYFPLHFGSKTALDCPSDSPLLDRPNNSSQFPLGNHQPLPLCYHFGNDQPKTDSRRNGSCEGYVACDCYIACDDGNAKTRPTISDVSRTIEENIRANKGQKRLEKPLDQNSLLSDNSTVINSIVNNIMPPTVTTPLSDNSRVNQLTTHGRSRDNIGDHSTSPTFRNTALTEFSTFMLSQFGSATNNDAAKLTWRHYHLPRKKISEIRHRGSTSPRNCYSAFKLSTFNF